MTGVNQKMHFALKLIPPRPDFAQTMTDDEKKIMQEHVTYWMDLMSKGFVIVYGPIMDPAATYGLGVVAVDNEDQVKNFIAGDPATKLNRYEYYPMRAIYPPR